MNTFFTNKVVLVTGGTDGIGKALVNLLLLSGAKVATCGRSQSKLDELQKIHSNDFLFCISADISNQEDCNRFVDAAIHKFGGIDILINNAGISMKAEMVDCDAAVIKKVMDINFMGMVYCTKHAMPSIIARKGTIAGISSIAGYRGLPGRSGYSASKFAMNGWLEALRTELLESGVNVMWVCPGFTKSNIRNVALNESSQSQGESPIDENQLMSAEMCAQNILKAISKSKRTLVLTLRGKQTVWLNKLFPSWADKLTRNFFYRNGQLKQ
jgi:short-subunit dehydrogenase